MSATKDVQKQLLTLADTDEEIRRLDHKRANLDEQVTLDNHVEIQTKVMDELIEATKTKDNLEIQTSRLEREIDVVVGGRKDKEAQIYSGRITDEKSLEAIRGEARDLERRKNDLEDSLLEAMEQLEEVSSLVDELTSRRSELKDQIVDLERVRDEASADIDAELAQVRERRQAEVAEIPDDVLETYDGLRGKRGGRRAVAPLEGRSCGGCRLELTAIDLEEIKADAARGLAYCPQCGSIIVP